MLTVTVYISILCVLTVVQFTCIIENCDKTSPLIGVNGILDCSSQSFFWQATTIAHIYLICVNVNCDSKLHLNVFEIIRYNLVCVTITAIADLNFLLPASNSQSRLVRHENSLHLNIFLRLRHILNYDTALSTYILHFDNNISFLKLYYILDCIVSNNYIFFIFS